MRSGFYILLASSLLCLFAGCQSSGGKAKALAETSVISTKAEGRTDSVISTKAEGRTDFVISTKAEGRTEKSLRAFYSSAPLLEDDIRVSEDRFADFAERCAAAPAEDALSAIDSLLDRLKAEDEVAYYIYAGWIEGAFYNPLSPCRNETLFTHAVDRIAGDGVLSEDECAPYLKKCHWMTLNRVGEKAVLPEPDAAGRATLVLVLDLSCPSCREALSTLGADPRFSGFRHLALCCGHGPLPEVPDWEYEVLDRYSEYFDLRATPFYYLIAPSGLVTLPYTPAL